MINYDKLKLELMMNGIGISERTKAFLTQKSEKFINDDYVTTTGIMLEVYSDTTFYVTSHLNQKSEYILEYEKNNLYIAKNNKKIVDVNVWKPLNIDDAAPTAFDRVRISPIVGCSFNCAFCSLNQLPYKKHSIEELDLGISKALESPQITHILISGGSPSKVDLPYLTECYEYFSKKYSSRYPLDVMMAPRGFDDYFDKSQYLDYIKFLKSVGVNALSINIELYNQEYLKKYCPEKYAIGIDNYLYFLKCASEIFGTEKVRSCLIVGLEPIEDTLKGVEAICKTGCMPMLSPYIPYNGISDYPSVDLLINVLEKTNKILKKYNIPLAPLCKKCKHNTI